MSDRTLRRTRSTTWSTGSTNSRIWSRPPTSQPTSGAAASQRTTTRPWSATPADAAPPAYRRAADEADDLARKGRYREAAALFRQAAADAEAVLGPDAPQLAVILNNWGVVDKYSAHFDEARALYGRALAIAEAGGDELRVASILHNLGGLEHARGTPARGEGFARRSVAIRTAVLGRDHPDTAADSAALAAIVDACGRPDEAEALLQEALGVFEQALGADHHEVAVTLNNLAAIHQRRGELDAAVDLYRRAVSIKERVLGPEHPETATTLNNLATALRRGGRPVEAAELFDRALSILEHSLGPNHPSTVVCRANAGPSLTPDVLFDVLRQQEADESLDASPSLGMCLLDSAASIRVDVR